MKGGSRGSGGKGGRKYTEEEISQMKKRNASAKMDQILRPDDLARIASLYQSNINDEAEHTVKGGHTRVSLFGDTLIIFVFSTFRCKSPMALQSDTLFLPYASAC